MNLTKRGLFTAGPSALLLSAALAGSVFAQEGGGAAALKDVPRRKATTKVLFKSPSGWPNALASSPQGLWVAEQKPRGNTRKNYGLTYSDESSEDIWLMDNTGKVLRTLTTEGRNTSGLAWGNGSLWSCALSNEKGNGVYEIDPMTGKTRSHHQLPLGLPEEGGGAHGAFWLDGKLWVFANRFNGVVRIEPKTWAPEFVLPFPVAVSPRYHGVAWDNGAIWATIGNATAGYSDATFGVAKFDARTGKVLEIVDFEKGSADPHGLCMHNGKLLSCDAGIHPGWKVGDSPTWGSVFEINIA
jgi:hypothetical protein